MKSKTKLIILTIIILLFLGAGYYFFEKTFHLKVNGEVTKNNQDEGFDYSNYCEATEDTCLPADKCEFQNNTDGTKICMGKY
jgi:hypothetical protein